MDFIFCSDIHLDHCDDSKKKQFFTRISNETESLILCAGDIGTYPNLVQNIEEFKNVNKDLHYIFGNHDFWDGPGVFEQQSEFATEGGYMTFGKPFLLPGTDILVVGQDGFYDAKGKGGGIRYMTDMFRIPTFRGKGVVGQEAIVRRIAKNSVMKIKKIIGNTAPSKILLITHVPPFFVKNRHHDPRIDSMYQNKVLGDFLSKLDIPTVVLCGHTHEQCDIMVGKVRQMSFNAQYELPTYLRLSTEELFNV